MQKVYITYCSNLATLQGIEGCAELQSLYVASSIGLRDISSLAGCMQLKSLNLGCAPVDDLNVLLKLPCLHFSHVHA